MKHKRVELDENTAALLGQLCARLNLRPVDVIAMAIRNLHTATTPVARYIHHPANLDDTTTLIRARLDKGAAD